MSLNKLTVLALLQFVLCSYLSIRNFLNSNIESAVAWGIVSGIAVIYALNFKDGYKISV